MVTRELCSFFVRAIVYIRAFAIFYCLRSFLEQLSLMPQQLNVLRCYSCKMYQVHIAKKSHKWQCKICNEKQSFRTIYFCGTGSECRNYVQTQNIAASTAGGEENFRTAVIDGWGLDCEADGQSDDPCDCGQRKSAIAKFSRNFYNRDDSTEKENVGELPWKRPRIETGEQRSRSLPVGDSLSVRDSRSQSFPQSKRTEQPSKWDRFLEGGESKTSRSQDESLSQPVDKLKVYDVENTEDFWSNEDSRSVARPSDENDDERIVTGDLKASRVDSDASSLAGQVGHNLFEDSNDELDVDLDF